MRGDERWRRFGGAQTRSVVVVAPFDSNYGLGGAAFDCSATATSVCLPRVSGGGWLTRPS